MLKNATLGAATTTGSQTSKSVPSNAMSDNWHASEFDRKEADK